MKFHYHYNYTLIPMLLLLLYITLHANNSTGTYILDKTIAIINDEIILESDIKNTKKFNNQYIDHYLYKIQNNKIFSQKKILNQIITNTLILQLAKQTNINIDKNQINEIIKYLAIQNNMTTKQFLSYLKSKNIDYTDYIEYIRKNTIIDIICDYEMHQRIKILPQELKYLTKKLIKKNNNTIFKIDHILIPLQENANNDQIAQAKTFGSFLIQEIQHGITIKQLKNLYTKKNTKLLTFTINKIDWNTLDELPTLFAENLIKQNNIQINDIIGPIQSNIGFHILIIKDINNNNNINENLITKIHTRHILIQTSNIKNDQEIQTELLKITKHIQNKQTTFFIEAQKISEDPNSSNNGGDLGWKYLENFDEKIQNVLKSLNKGEISKPIKTNYGWHIIQLIDIKHINKNENFSQENAYQTILNNKIKETMQHWIQELKTLTYIKILNNNDQ